MGRSTVKINYQPLILVVSGELPTLPIDLNGKPGDAGWRDTDLLIGQHAYNVADNIFYIRNKNSIVPLSSSSSYTHDQGVPATLWTVNHKLHKHPSVSVVDTAGTVVYGMVNYVTVDKLTITFSAAFSGKAYCN